MILIPCKRLLCLMILLGVFLPGANIALGDTISVNAEGTGDYATIQAAINASSDGDAIELADGVYTGVGNRNLNYHGKSICVRSISGNPENCILDCEGQGRGFDFLSGEDLSARVEGLTIRNGDAYSSEGGGMYSLYGGAVLIIQSAVTFEHCRFIENDALMAGAIAEFYSEAVFLNCVLQDNTSLAGGGMYCEDSELHMYHTSISGNISGDYGGGIATYGCDLVLIAVVFSENASTAFSGGGLFNNATSLLAVDCVFEKNAADSDGSGAYIANGFDDAILVNCRFCGNTAGKRGGGIFLLANSGAVDLIGCVVTQNTARSGGGMGIVSESLPVIYDCTIMNNCAEVTGGGIYVLPHW